MTIGQFNSLSREEAREKLFQCCGSTTWVENLMSGFPFASKEELRKKSDEAWKQCDRGDWLEAFSHHPRIGEQPAKQHEATASWASGEQSGVRDASDKTKQDLSEYNYLYQKKFGFIYIVCATGKGAAEMLDILKNRIKNRPEEELRIAAEEQNKITHIRIDKLIA